jgi:signal transduction histidine kinase
VIDPAAEPVVFHTDPVLIERVIGNLVKNALEACRPGQTVTLCCWAEPDQVIFSVHNPSHMPRDVELQIFQRSFSTKGQGRGLGTYSIKLFTERYLRGSVSFTTSAEGGTTFRAAYPLRLDSASAG